MKIHLAVEIETAQGVFRRVNTSPYTVDATDDTWEPASGVLFYPDRRAKRLKVFAPDGADYRLVKTFTLASSRRDNYAFVLVDSIDMTEFESAETLQLQGYNNGNEVIPGRAKVSETNQPLLFKADKTYYIGNGNSKITAFATNTLAVSEGQFGQFPLYVFCEDSIWALGQGRDLSVAFEQTSPVSQNHGAKSPQQITNIGRSICFSYKKGLFILSQGEPVEISQPVNNYPGHEPVDFDSMVIGSRMRAGYNEILLSDGVTVYVYNLYYRRWYMVDRNRAYWFTHAGTLYGINGSGDIYNEHDNSSSAVSFEVVFDPIHFLQPETLKRLSQLFFRGDVSDHTLEVTPDDHSSFSTTKTVLKLKHRSAYSFRVELSGVMSSDDEYIEAISAQVESRYPHKNKV